ncbi:MAG: MFS transporter [Alphaproteobacteria bacterium]
MAKTYRTASGFIANAVTMTIVAGLSLVLLLYVGYGEATRTLQQFQVDRLASQGRYLQSAMNEFLRPGHPIKQFVGFNAKTGTILASDPTIRGMAIFDSSETFVFGNGVAGKTLLAPATEVDYGDNANVAVRADDEMLQVLLPLMNRFEQVATLVISMNKSVVTNRVRSGFEPLLAAVLFAAVAFGIATSVLGADLGARKRWLNGLFAVSFIGVSGVVIATLVTLYSEGAQAKSKSMADTLGQRLSNIVAFGLNIWEIDGIDTLLADYRALNPDMAHAAIIVDGAVRFHTTRSVVGQGWKSNPNHYEYISDMSQPGGRDIKLAVAIPSDVVFRQTVRSIKNFGALFIASALMAGVFLQIAGSLRRLGSHAEPNQHPARAGPVIRDGGDAALLNLVKPVFFIAVASEHLAYAFLPQYVISLIEAAGLSQNYASVPFTLYYLLFAISLVPAGHLSQRFGARPLMVWGLMASGLGLAGLTLVPDFLMLCGARALSGIGQGILFIGVQSYILDTASPERKTRGAAIIVFGFQGGMITGMAIGSLLVTHIGQTDLFMLASSVAFMMAAYTIIVVPGRGSVASVAAKAAPPSLTLMARDLTRVFRDLEFIRTMLLVGIPAKAVLTGVVIFALPLMLSAGDYRQEDIGQILMIYAGCVMVSSGYVSAFVDRTKRTDDVLLAGCFISALALLGIGIFGPSGLKSEVGSDQIDALAMILSVALLGLSHGLINAPVVTHVASTDVAEQTGAATVTATYRFLERAGHVAGPAIIGQLLATGLVASKSIAWIGVAILLMAALFALKPSRKVASNQPTGS